MILAFEDRAEMRVCESDQMVIELYPTDAASVRAALTARASAIRAELTGLRFEELDRDTLEMGLLMNHPKPPQCVAKLHAASTKHCISVGRVLGWIDLRVGIGRDEEALPC